MSSIAAMIMAAGQGSRFDGCKLLASVDGQPLLGRSIETTRQIFRDDVYVVTGAWHTELLSAQQQGELPDAKLLYNDHWVAGLGCSIAFGATQLAQDYDGILIILADQVALSSDDLQRLLSRFEGDNIVCSYYQQKRGVPALFCRNSFKRLQQLSGDRGAQAILYESEFPVDECAMPSAAIDIDTRQQLAAWSNPPQADQRPALQ